MMLKTLLLISLFSLIEPHVYKPVGGPPCPRLPLVEHGKYKLLRKNQVQVICDPSYIYIDPLEPLSEATVIYCKYGNWSNPAPRCSLPSDNCEPPAAVEHGKIRGFPPFTVGSTIQYYCEENYILEGPDTRTCQRRIYEWTDHDPLCLKNDPTIAGIAGRLDDQVHRMDGISTGVNRIIGYDVEFLGLDLFLVFDKSSSILPSDFQKGIEFAKFLIERFNVMNGDVDKEGGTRISILTFGDKHAEIVTLDDKRVRNTRIAQQKLDSIKCGDICDGSTNMAAALSRVEFVAEHLSREKAKKALFITSDGVPNDPAAVDKIAESLKKLKVEIYTIGVGRDIDKHLLRSIASKPSVEHVFLLDKFSDFDEMVQKIREKPKPTPPPTLDKCGYLTEIGKKSKITKPGEIEVSSSPWLAAIIIGNGGESKFSCTGALICSQWVLAPASCLVRFGSIVNETSVYVTLGEDNLVEESKHEQYFYVTEIHVNDEYLKSRRIQDDIALIKLNDHAKFTDYVRTACIPKAERISTRPDTELSLSGWLTLNEDSVRLPYESTKTYKPSQTNVTVIGIENCEGKIDLPIECYDKATGGASVGSEFSEKCIDDNGSLLTYVQEGHHELIGLVSKSRGCDIKNKVAFFVRLSSYHDWIGDVTSDCIVKHV